MDKLIDFDQRVVAALSQFAFEEVEHDWFRGHFVIAVDTLKKSLVYTSKTDPLSDLTAILREINLLQKNSSEYKSFLQYRVKNVLDFYEGKQNYPFYYQPDFHQTLSNDYSDYLKQNDLFKDSILDSLSKLAFTDINFTDISTYLSSIINRCIVEVCQQYSLKVPDFEIREVTGKSNPFIICVRHVDKTNPEILINRNKFDLLPNIAKVGILIHELGHVLHFANIKSDFFGRNYLIPCAGETYHAEASAQLLSLLLLDTQNISKNEKLAIIYLNYIVAERAKNISELLDGKVDYITAAKTHSNILGGCPSALEKQYKSYINFPNESAIYSVYYETLEKMYKIVNSESKLKNQSITSLFASVYTKPEINNLVGAI